MSLDELFYCPFAPCCSQCVGTYTFRDVLSHLRRVHEKTPEEIRKLIHIGLSPVPLTPGRKNRQSKIFYEKRNQDMVALYQSGAMTLERLGKHFGLTKERVRQVVAKAFAAIKEQK